MLVHFYKFSFSFVESKMKKNLLILLLLAVLGKEVFSQNNMGIGTENPDPSAILDISDTTKGVLVPRMSSIQRLAIPSPSNGLLVFDITEDCFLYYSQLTLSWVSLCSLIGPTGPTGAAGGPIGPTGATGATGISNIQTFGAYGTSSVNVTTTNFITIPGLSLTVNLTDTATLNIYTYGGLRQSSSGSGNAAAFIQVFNNNAAVTTAYEYYDLNTSFIPTSSRTNWSMITFLSLPPGSYEIDIRAKKYTTGSDNFYAGTSNYSSSALIIQVFY